MRRRLRRMYVLDFGGAPGVLARQAVAEHVHGNVADAEDLEDAVKALGDGANSATQTRMWVRACFGVSAFVGCLTKQHQVGTFGWCHCIIKTLNSRHNKGCRVGGPAAELPYEPQLAFAEFDFTVRRLRSAGRRPFWEVR